jgi:hypothetical protein
VSRVSVVSERRMPAPQMTPADATKIVSKSHIGNESIVEISSKSHTG